MRATRVDLAASGISATTSVHPRGLLRGLPSRMGTHASFYDQPIIEHGEVRNESGYTTDLWTKRGIEFIEANRERPFFLFLAYNGPYVLGNLMLNESRNRHRDTYRDKHFLSFPVDTMHPWQLHNKQFHNTQAAMERTVVKSRVSMTG